MESKNYNINNLEERKLFYMLDNITDESVKLFRRTPAGDEEYTLYDLHRMPDGKLLIAFYAYWTIQTIHSLVAICGDEEEHVSATPFERILPHWNPPLNAPRGLFLFMNSKPIYTDVNDWRCDNTFYGPERYLSEGATRILPVFALEDLIVWEPMITIHGISSLSYLHLKSGENMNNTVVNEDIIPASTVTLSEMFRLLTEWAALAEEPFNSTEPIVLDAKEFLNQLGFDSSLVADQTNMQVAQYLMGSTDARRRPTDVVETNQELFNFIKRKMAHLSLANLLSCYPEYEDINLEIQRDIESAENEFSGDLNNMRIEGEYSLDNYEDCLDLIPDNYVNGVKGYGFRWSLLKRKKDLASSLL
jgi:hypothetical protein